MNKVIVISNDGLMDIAALTLMGVSSKREDHTKIGMFGTGMKYAIARMLKLNIPFEIWLGNKQVPVTKQPGEMRGQPYERIIIDDVPTSITTDMGPQWEPWTIVREILSNARDESMPEFYVSRREDLPANPADRTTFILDYAAFEQVWLNREKYFVNEREALHDSPTLRIYKKLGEGTRIYKNGILVSEVQTEDAFDYDLPTIELNEMREVRYDWQTSDQVLGGLTAHLKDRPLIKQWLQEVNTHNRMGKQGFDTTFVYPNDEWIGALTELDKPIVKVSDLGPQFIADSASLILPNGVVHGLKGKVRTQQQPVMALTTEMQFVKDQALMTLFAAHFKVQHDIVVMDLGMGYYSKPDLDAKRILMSPKAFDNVETCLGELLTCELELRTNMKRDSYQFGPHSMKAFADIIFLNANQEPQTARSHEESSDSPPTSE